MNKLIVVISVVIISACASVPNDYTFDSALENAIQKIENDLPANSDIAILDFKSDNANLSSYIIEEIYDKLINGRKLSIMERSRIDAISKEVGYQFSGNVDDNEIISIGHQLGANFVVTGQITFSGQSYRLRVFAIDIEKGRRVASSALNIKSDDKQINYLLTVKTNQPIDSTIQNKVYKVGDIGPAGGRIFYDKGEVSRGWRYLEAAPSETEFLADCGIYFYTARRAAETVGTGSGIGTGKANTKKLAEIDNARGETDTAAQLCESLVVEGFDDWFLPSKDELNLMYKNLKDKGLNGFGGFYWSSTDDFNWDQQAVHLWQQSFYDGEQFSRYEMGGMSTYVWAVRSF